MAFWCIQNIRLRVISSKGLSQSSFTPLPCDILITLLVNTIRFKVVSSAEVERLCHIVCTLLSFPFSSYILYLFMGPSNLPHFSTQIPIFDMIYAPSPPHFQTPSQISILYESYGTVPQRKSKSSFSPLFCLKKLFSGLVHNNVCFLQAPTVNR